MLSDKDTERLRNAISEHCPIEAEREWVLNYHVAAIEFALEKHERIIGRFSQKERIVELSRSLNEAVTKMGSLTGEGKALFSRFIQLPDELRLQSTNSEQSENFEALVKVRVDHLKQASDGSTETISSREKTERKNLQPSSTSDHEAAFDLTYATLKRLHKAARRAEKHPLANNPPVANMNTRQVAVAAACNRIWYNEVGDRPPREINADAPGPFGRFQIAVFEAVGFKRGQSRTAQRALIDMGGIDAVRMYIELREKPN